MAQGITMQVTPVFAGLLKAYQERKNKYRGFILSGGTRSSKTVSIIQLILLYCQENAGNKKNILIARHRYSDLKDTIMADFFKMLEDYGMYKEENHQRSHPQSYTYFGNRINFRGLDVSGAHGEKRDVVWLNEAFEVEHDAFKQLNQRLTDFFIMDYNPCFTEHWILKSVKERNDVFYSHSTYKHNPFLSDEIIKEIEAYDPSNPENIEQGTADQYYWDVYGLGIGAILEGVIFKYVNWIEKFPADLDYWYSVDFGFTNDHTAISKVAIEDKNLYLEEMYYEPCDNPELLSDIFRQIGITQSDSIVADSSDKYISPKHGTVEMVKDLKKLGWNIQKVSKTEDLNYWIAKMKEYRINVVTINQEGKETNFKMEFQYYRWQKVNGQLINRPVDKHNHLIDSARYGLMFKKKRKGRRFWNS